MIAWDLGTPITGAGTVAGAGAVARVDLTTIPEFFGSSGDDPPRYYNLGTIGQYQGISRGAGSRIIYASQQLEAELTDPEGWYWVLPSGVSGTLYRGVEIDMANDLAIGATITNSVNQNAVAAGSVTLAFDTDVYDPWGMHDLAVNPSRLTIKYPGIYVITANVRWENPVTGNRQAQIQKNGNTALAIDVRPASTNVNMRTSQDLSTVARLEVGDYLEVIVTNDSGSANPIIAQTQTTPLLAAYRIGS